MNYQKIITDLEHHARESAEFLASYPDPDEMESEKAAHRAMVCAVHALRELTQEREKLEEKLRRELASVRRLIASERARKKSEAVNRKSKEYTVILERILGGETVTAVAKSLGVTPPSVQRKLRMGCRRTNAELYDAGIKPDETYNYCTPPLDYLRKHRAIFLPNNKVTHD